MVIVACVLILRVSIDPGQPAHTVFWAKFLVLLAVLPPLGLFMVPLLGWGIWTSRQWLFSPRVCPRWLAIASPIVAGITWGLVQLNLPQQLAFKLSRSAFETALDSVPVAVTQADKRMGLYKIERYGTDPRGGLYFRVRREDAGLDLIHYGFVYQPNQQGSPFGESNYTLEHLTDDWYIFSETSPFRL